MLNAGRIRPSRSPSSFPGVLEREKKTIDLGSVWITEL